MSDNPNPMPKSQADLAVAMMEGTVGSLLFLHGSGRRLSKHGRWTLRRCVETLSRISAQEDEESGESVPPPHFPT